MTQLFVDRAVLSAAVGAGAAILILLFGSDLLSWIWAVVAFVVCLGVAFYLGSKKLPSTYVVAQWIDARLKLADTLSTAAFFADPDQFKNSETAFEADPSIRDAQQKRAEEVVSTVDLKQALPMERPKAMYPAMGLIAAVIVLLVLRFAVLGTLDPKTSLVKSAVDSIMGRTPQELAANRTPGDPASPSAGNNPDSPEKADFADAEKKEEEDKAGSKDGKEEQSQSEKEGKSQDQNGQGDGNATPQMDKQNGGDQNQGNNSQNADAKQDPSLLDKLKDALSDMMNNSKPQQNNNGQNQKGKKGDSQSQASKQNSPNAQNQNGDQSDDSEGQNQQAQTADGQSEGDSSENSKSQDPQRGIGSGEGDKAAKQAAALKAMGKISELLGKRAENITGAVMVEVGSTKQQLKTAITSKQATHVEAGSEIHRDEIPLAYEQFVQQYFDQIRKGSPGAAPAAKAPTAAAPTKK
jgi:hypothetical protein